MGGPAVYEAEVEDINTWRLRRVSGSWASSGASWFATAPGCPNAYHPMRACKCRSFKNAVEARSFILDSNRALEG